MRHAQLKVPRDVWYAMCVTLSLCPVFEMRVTAECEGECVTV